MKIAQVCPYDCTWPGGVLAHISHLSNQFVAMGHEVKIMAPYTPLRDTAEEGNYLPVARSVPIPYGGSVARVSLSFWMQPRVQHILAQERFDVVHVHEPLAPLLSLYALQYSRAVNVGTFHAFYGSPRRYRFTHLLLRRWFQRLHGRIAVSRGAYQQVSRYFPGDYRVIPNGIAMERFFPAPPPLPQFKDGKLNILFVGRLEKRKGLRYLLEAYARLKWDFQDIRLIVVGPGNLDPDCWRVLGERALNDVVFVGRVSNKDLPRYYSSADIFCAPATGRESFGIVLLEAMAAAKPIVASQIPGYAAVVEQGQQALLVPPKNTEALAQALATLVRDPERRQRMGAAGPTVAEKYRWESIAQQVMDYYQSLLKDRKGNDGATR